MSNKNNDSPSNPSRRKLLRNAGLVGAAVASGGGVGSIANAQAATSMQVTAPVREALVVLTAAESLTLEANTDRILPSDESGPGAREARAVHYIDLSLAS
jgi:hypothetical protein